MKSIVKYLKILGRKLNEIWVIEIKYPKKFPKSQIKSLTNQKILYNTKGLFIEAGAHIKNPNIKIGKHTYIGNNTIIDSCAKIGAFSSISSNMKIGIRNHPLDYISTSPVFYSKYRRWLSDDTFNEG